jgi:hypothetical protein
MSFYNHASPSAWTGHAASLVLAHNDGLLWPYDLGTGTSGGLKRLRGDAWEGDAEFERAHKHARFSACPVPVLDMAMGAMKRKREEPAFGSDPVAVPSNKRRCTDVAPTRAPPSSPTSELYAELNTRRTIHHYYEKTNQALQAMHVTRK